MQRTIAIRYWWKRSDGNKDIPEEHVDLAEQDAQERIYTMLRDGYWSGELHACVGEGDVSREYRGWWKAEQQNENDENTA
jgi:hypothetical protein